MSEQRLTATHRVPIETTQHEDWTGMRAEAINGLVSHLWSAGQQLVGDVEIEEEDIADHDGNMLFRDIRATASTKPHRF